jgi:hypothetical protein
MSNSYDETKKARADLAAAKAKAKALRPWYQKKRFAIPLGFFALVILSNALMPSENTDVSSTPSESTSQSETPEITADLNSIEGLTAAIRNQLGDETNMGVPRSLETEIVDGDLYVRFALNENFTNNSMIGGAWGEVGEVVELVQLSGLSKNLTINGTLELIDANGNSLGQRNVFTANFLDDKVPLLNTENLIGRDLWENAASSFIYHPAIRD